MAVYPKSLITAVFKVEALLGRVWKNPNHLVEALCHPSFQSNDEFGRLAFLGEELEGCVSNHLCDTYPHLEFDQITRIVADNACRENYARRAVKSGLYQYLHHRSASLEARVYRYTRSLMTEGCIEPAPEALGIMIEAIAGALFLDNNKDMAEVWRVFKPILWPLIIKPHHLMLRLPLWLH